MKLKNIKDKFEDREIQPSADAWDKLSQRLDTTEKKNRKPIMLWLGAVAAVFVLGLTVIPSLFFNGDHPIPVENQVVIENPTAEDLVNEDVNGDLVVPNKGKQPLDVVTVEKEAVAVIESSNSKAKKPAVTKKESMKQDIAFEEPENNPMKPLETESAVAVEEPQIISADEMLTPQTEADALLNRALQNIQVIQATATTINPSKLLRETEWDLEARRHNRLENTLLDGLGRLKREAIALIDRNQ
jgi:hypothetical protein